MSDLTLKLYPGRILMPKKLSTVDRQAALRQHVVEVLKGGHAHATFDAAVKNLPAAQRGKRPKGAEHSPWEILEHLRIAQWDILEFSRDPKHQSPDWPTGYWPARQVPSDEKAWDKSVRTLRRDLKAMCELVTKESTDLFAEIPHGSGQTILREALLLADHNAYHLGEMVLVRRELGVWG
jgi:DinB superfamily